MPETISVSRVIPASPHRIYEAWLDGDEHGKMIGSTASYEGDGRFTAWDGYIAGQTLEQHPHWKIVQAWRTTEFPDGSPDSRITVLLEPEDAGTRVTIRHEDIPEGQGQSYETGWQDHYFDPMTSYFQTPSSRLKEIGDVMEDAAEKAQDALEDAARQLEEGLEEATAKARKAVENARRGAQKQAAKVVKAAKKVQKKAAKQAKAIGKKVKALTKRKPKKAAGKKPAKKAAPKKSARKAAPKKKATARRAAPKKKAAGRRR